MNLQGKITTFLGALGLRQGDDRILDAVTVIAAGFDEERFDDLAEEYWSFNGRGVEFLFQQDTLTSIFFHLRQSPDDPELGVWDEPLVDGLPLAPDTTQLRTVLGEPESTGTGDHGPWLRYDLGKSYLHFEYAGDGLAMITAMDKAGWHADRD